MTNGLIRQLIDHQKLVVLLGTLYCLFFTNSAGSGNESDPTEYSLSKQLTKPAFTADSTLKPKPSTLVIKVFASDITKPLTSATAVITSTITGHTQRLTMPTGQLERTFPTADQLSIDISAPGYTSVNRKMTIPVSPQGNRYEFDAELDRTMIGLTVSAVDRLTGNLIPGVRFTISGKTMGTKSITLTPDSTTSLAKVELPGKGTYALSSTANEYTGFIKSIKLDSVQNEARVILTAKQLPTEPKPVAQKPTTDEVPVVKPTAKAVTTAPITTSPVSIPVTKTKPLEKLEKGRSISLPDIYFDQSSPVLRPESYAELDQLYNALSGNPALQIEIRGHTDNQGDFDLNVKLSRDRCHAIIDYLVNKGISKIRLKAVGRGPIDPIAPNNNEENRKKNRRVELVMI